jgi:hypothetical protein
MLDGDPNQLAARSDRGLKEQLLQGVLYGAFRDFQSSRNPLVGKALHPVFRVQRWAERRSLVIPPQSIAQSAAARPAFEVASIKRQTLPDRASWASSAARPS